jgi:simple sugar transport system permease protein
VAVPAFAAPFLLAITGLIITERAGTINLGAEGIMAVGALTGVIAVAHGAPWWGGLAAAILAGTALTAVFALLAVVLRIDQVLAGLVTFALGIGGSGYVGGPYANLPVAGVPAPSASGVLAILAQDPVTWFALLSAVLVWWVLQRTELGLRLRATGEDAAAADAAGVNVLSMRVGATLVGGAFLSLAGAHLSLVGSHIWIEGMISGRGWIAIALVVFSQWSPLRAIGAALMFGAIQAAIPRLQSIGVPVPVFILLMVPYLATIVVLLTLAVRRRASGLAPRDLGRPYLREERR